MLPPPSNHQALNQRRLTKEQVHARKRKEKRSVANRMKMGAWRALHEGTAGEFGVGPAKRPKMNRPPPLRQPKAHITRR